MLVTLSVLDIPLSLEAIRSTSPAAGGVQIDFQIEQEVVAVITGPVFDFQLQIVNTFGQVQCRGQELLVGQAVHRSAGVRDVTEL